MSGDGWSGWAEAMQEVVENEFSERAERMIPPDTPRGSDMDVPPAIIESATIDSVPLIQLDTLESEKEEDEEEDEQVTTGSWLDLAESSSSKESQGSHANQVSVFSGTGSPGDPLIVAESKVEQQHRKPAVLAPINTTQQQPWSDAALVAHLSPGGRSLYDTPSDEGFGKSVLGTSAHKPIYVMEEELEHTKESRYLDDMLSGIDGNQDVSKHSTGIDDVLGPRGDKTALALLSSRTKDSEGVDDILGPKGKLLLPSPDSIDEFLSSPQNQPEFDAVDVEGVPSATGAVGEAVNEAISEEIFQPQPPRDCLQTAPSETPQEPSQYDDYDGIVVGRIVQSLGDHQRAQTRPSRCHRFIETNESTSSRDKSLMSDSSRSEGRSSDDPNSPRSESQRDYGSEDTSFSGDGNTLSRGSTMSPRTETISPTSRSQTTSHSQDSRSQQDTDTYHTYSYGDSTLSRVDSTTLSRVDSTTLSRVDSTDPSFLSNQTGFTGRTGRTTYTEYTERSVFTETDASCTGPSDVPTSPGSVSGVDSNGTGFFTAIERVVVSNLASPRDHAASTERGLSPPSTGIQNQWDKMLQLPDKALLENAKSNAAGFFMAFERAVASNIASPMAHDVPTEQSCWSPVHADTMESIEQAPHDEVSDRQPERKQSQFAQSLLAKTRSRAEPGAPVASVASPNRSEYSRPVKIKVEEELNERFIRDTALARKRVSVVQLLLVGLISMLFCFIGGIGIQSSCHFVAADVQVGATEKVYKLHYGLWKFSPIGSAFQGYTYCDSYDEAYSVPPPNVPRVSSLLAFLCGAYAVLVLWLYLIFGQATRLSWYAAANLAVLSAFLHGASLLIFVSPVCEDRDCELGPAGALTLAACAVSFFLAFEMYYNSPITSWRDDVPGCPSDEEPSRMIQSLELTHIEESVLAYYKRLIPNAMKEMPTLNQFQRNNEDHHTGDGRDSSRKIVYSPPALV